MTHCIVLLDKLITTISTTQSRYFRRYSSSFFASISFLILTSRALKPLPGKNAKYFQNRLSRLKLWSRLVMIFALNKPFPFKKMSVFQIFIINIYKLKRKSSNKKILYANCFMPKISCA